MGEGLATTSAVPTSDPEPKNGAYYRLTLSKHLQVPGRDPFRLVQFWLFVASFIALEWWVITAPTWWMAAWAALPLALILVALFNLLHELMHYSIVKNRTVTWFHGFIAGFFTGLTPDSWKNEHDAHHNHVGVAGEDPDAVYDLKMWREQDGIRKAVSLLPGSRNWISYLARPFWWMGVHGQMLFTRFLAQKNVSKGRKALAIAVFTFDVLSQFTFIYLFGARYFLWGFLLPVMIHNLLLTYFLLGTHLHSRRSDEKDPVLGSCSFDMGWLTFAYLDAGRHSEHHVYPQTSHRKLGEVQAKLKKLFPDRYRLMTFGASIRALEGSGRVYVGDTTLWQPEKDFYASTIRVEGGHVVPPAHVPAPFSERPVPVSDTALPQTAAQA
jgi:fatty acid desaturase